MPTNQNAYNSRVTDEALEKKFRDTFRSQGGAELVDDLYASGVIVPVVDFTSAAEGSALRPDLQAAWDFSTGSFTVNNTDHGIITTPGFWKIDLNVTFQVTSGTATQGRVFLDDGSTEKDIWSVADHITGAGASTQNAATDSFIVFVRAGEQVYLDSNAVTCTLTAWYRQIADVYGNLTNPLGFVSS